MNRDPEKHGHEVKRDLPGRWNNMQFEERVGHDRYSHQSADHAVQAELTEGRSELAVHRLQQDKIEFPSPNQFREIRQIGIKERLKNLADDLVGTNKQDHVPLRPVAQRGDLIENHLNEHQLPDEPEQFDDDPEQKVQLEVHLPDERIPQHHEINFPVLTGREGEGIHQGKGRSKNAKVQTNRPRALIGPHNRAGLRRVRYLSRPGAYNDAETTTNTRVRERARVGQSIIA